MADVAEDIQSHTGKGKEELQQKQHLLNHNFCLTDAKKSTYLSVDICNSSSLEKDVSVSASLHYKCIISTKEV